MRKIIKQIGNVLALMMSYINILIGAILSYLVPNKKGQMVFANASEQPEFSGNMKYLYLDLSNRYGKECIWITEYDRIHELLSRNGYSVYKKNSIIGNFHILRSEYAVTSVDFSKTQWAYLQNTQTLQLWHGIPLKSLPTNDIGWPLDRFINFDYAFLNSKFEENELRTHKNIDEVIYSGYPRNDVFFRNIQDSQMGVSPNVQYLLNDLQEETVIGYFPTWRDSEAVPPIETSAFEEFLVEVDAHCVIKPHRYMPQFIDGEHKDRIHVLPPYGDIYPFLDDIDILVTDYSSIYFDYLFVDNPMVFYAFDIRQYNKTRGFHLNYDNVTPGPVAESFPDLCNCLRETIEIDEYTHERYKLRNKIYQHQDGKAVERIHEVLF